MIYILFFYKINKKSIDARNKEDVRFIYEVDVEVLEESKVLKKNNEISLDCDVSVYDRRSETKEKSEVTKNSKSFSKYTRSFTTKNSKESTQIKNIIMTKFHKAMKKQKQ